MEVQNIILFTFQPNKIHIPVTYYKIYRIIHKLSPINIVRADI